MVSYRMYSLRVVLTSLSLFLHSRLMGKSSLDIILTVMANSIFFRWVLYSALMTIVPQTILNLGFEDNAWHVAVRKLAYGTSALVFCVLIRLVLGCRENNI